MLENTPSQMADVAEYAHRAESEFITGRKIQKTKNQM